MIRRILNWMPRSWPFLSLKSILVYLVIYFTPDLVVHSFLRIFHLPMGGEVQRLLVHIHAGALGFFLVIMGFGRVSVPHPVANRSYRKWLKTTPWHPRTPLPLGPITLNFYDLTMLVVTGLLFMGSGMSPELAVLLFGIPYTLSIMRSLLVTGPARIDYLLLLGLLALAWALPDVRLAAVILIAVYPVEHLAIRHSLKSFPWEPQVPKHAVPLGWTFQRLGPEPTTIRVPFFDALIVSLLMGAAVFVVLSKSVAETRSTLEGGFALAGIIAALIRFGIYSGGTSTLGIFTRLVTGRLVIPGYDQILVAPFLITTLLVAASVLATQRSIQPVEAGALGAVVIFVLLGVGPSLRSFRLVGTYSISRPSRTASRQKLSAPP